MPISGEIGEVLGGYEVTSVTPIALGADSRTLKQAASFARAGAKSLIIEGVASGRDFSRLNITVASLHDPARASESTTTANVFTASSTFRNRVKRMLPRKVVEFVRFLSILRALVKNEWWPLYRMLPRSDLYVLHAMNLWPAVWLKSKVTGRPYIYDAHDFYREMSAVSSVDRFQRDWMLPLYAFLDRRAARNAAAVSTVSDGVAALYSNADGIRPVVVRNSHDPRADVSPTQTVRERAGVEEDKFLIVAVGNAKPGSSIGKLISLLNNLDTSIHLAFVGRGFELLRKEVRNARIASRLHFLDALPPDEVVPFIRDADCAIIVYFAETDNYEAALPNRFFQSVSASLPLIYPRLSEMHKVAQAFQFGVSFRPDDEREMEDAIRRVFEDREHFVELQTQARRASETLSWSHEERVLISLAKEIIRRPLRRTNSAVR